MGAYVEKDCEDAKMIQAVLNVLRKQGYSCTLPPEDYEIDLEKDEKLSASELKLEFLKDNCDPIQVSKDGQVQIVLEQTCGWMYIYCANEATAQLVNEKLYDMLVLGQVRHVKETIHDENGIVVTERTGNGESDPTSCSPTSLFELTKDGKVVSKLLCSYHNCEMDNPGPTIEMLETAKEWQGHGLATLLLKHVVENHFMSCFKSLREQG